jgi:chaperone modulatory protein CbpM
MASHTLERPARLSLDRFAARTGLHPGLVRRFVALGLLEAVRDARPPRLGSRSDLTWT